MGRYRSVTIGAPSFHEGEEVVLFLGAQPPALPFVLGLGQNDIQSGGFHFCYSFCRSRF
jgi:hypothetical protein